MNYQQTTAWMFDRLPMYQTQGATAFRKNLDNIRKLIAYLGHPEKNLRCIQVAGTNGKGSTSHMLASVLQEAGYKTGLFTSPHLKDYRERIKINGAEIPEAFVVEFVAKHKPFFEAQDMSFFEMSVGLMLDYFTSEAVDIAVVETGLGGRLDATNIVQPLLSVITNIALEHTQYLGDTLAQIAAEKAGIIKDNVPVVIGQTTPETKPVFETISKQRYAPVYWAEHSDFPGYQTDLAGHYQRYNLRTVVTAIDILRNVGLNIPETAVAAGLSQVVKNTNFLGRWQILGQHPKIICDTAHNLHGMTEVVAQLTTENFDRLHVVLGMVSDKNPDEIVKIFPQDAIFYVCRPNNFRALEVGVLAEVMASFGFEHSVYNSVPEAYKAAIDAAGPRDLIFAGGSNFVVAEIL